MNKYEIDTDEVVKEIADIFQRNCRGCNALNSFFSQCAKDIENFKGTGSFKSNVYGHNDEKTVKRNGASKQNNPQVQIIKTERASGQLSENDSENVQLPTAVVKAENEMPAPQFPVVRARKPVNAIKVESSGRCTRSKASKAKAIENEAVNNTYLIEKVDQDADVVLQMQRISIVTLDDTVHKNTPGKADGTNGGVSPSKNTPENAVDVKRTFQPTKNTPENAVNIDDLMTDDESIVETEDPPKPEVKTKVKEGMKAIFSPFENSPVKKRIEAFEKLGVDSPGDVPSRSTRTKTKAKQETKEAQLIDQLQTKAILKASTPLSAGRLVLRNEKILPPPKCSSASKVAQQEFIERETIRRKKEAEATRKKQELLQAQIEEKRRKREEKQLKARENRELQEKSKKLLELQKSKEEKRRLALAELQEKRQKQREEAENRRLLAAKMAADEKAKEEQTKALQGAVKKVLQEEKTNKPNKKTAPIYMTQKAPLLPTDECYDSDEPEASANRRTIVRPKWTRREYMKLTLNCMQYAGNKIKNTLFSRESQTPDLRDIFANIDPKKLKRTSSAVWSKPPRFTLMPLGIDSFNETDENIDT